MSEQFDRQLDSIILNALEEDIGEGDHSSLACVAEKVMGSAELLVKDDGILAGVEVARHIIRLYDPNLKMLVFFEDGSMVERGNIAFRLNGRLQSILTCERLILNCMQRMSGIATQTNRLVKKIAGHRSTILDTRKTTPGLRLLEKWAVRIGGGKNHRYALYDMIMLKDNHIDAAGGVGEAISKTILYLQENNRHLKIEIEVRNMDELEQVLSIGQVDRIMLDNFTPEQVRRALLVIPQTYEVEVSGGIDENNILAYAQTEVEFISVGALTHSFKSLDLSLKVNKTA